VFCFVSMQHRQNSKNQTAFEGLRMNKGGKRIEPRKCHVLLVTAGSGVSIKFTSGLFIRPRPLEVIRD
jgi:hypothetical protein